MKAVNAMVSAYGADFLDASDAFPGPRGETVRDLVGRVGSLTEALISSLRQQGVSYQEILTHFSTRPRLGGLIKSTSSLDDILELFATLFPEGVEFAEDKDSKAALKKYLPSKIENLLSSGTSESKYDFTMFYREFSQRHLQDPKLKSIFQNSFQDRFLGGIRSPESLPYLSDEFPIKLVNFFKTQDISDELVEKIISNPNCWNSVSQLAPSLAISREMQLKIMRDPELASKLRLHSRESLSLVAEVVLGRVPELPSKKFLASNFRKYFGDIDYVRHLEIPSQTVSKDLLVFLNSSPEAVSFFAHQGLSFLRRLLMRVERPEKIWDAEKFYQALQGTSWSTVESLIGRNPLFALDMEPRSNNVKFRAGVVAEAVKQYAATGDAFSTKVLSYVSENTYGLGSLMTLCQAPLLGGSVESHVQEVKRLASGSSVSELAAILAMSYHYQEYAHMQFLALCDNYEFVSKFHMAIRDDTGKVSADLYQGLYVSLHWRGEDLPKEVSRLAPLEELRCKNPMWANGSKGQEDLTALLAMYLESWQVADTYQMIAVWSGTLRDLIESVIASHS